jgi:hypothetical protein
MTQVVTWEPRTGLDEYSRPTYGAATAVRCRVVGRTKLVLDTNGQEVVSTTVVYCDGNPGISPEDRVTLPDGSQPVILRVESYPDETGQVYQQVLT